MTKYLFNNHISTRVIPDPACEEFIDFWPGDIKEDKDLPDHLPISSLLEAGHMEICVERKRKQSEDSPAEEQGEE